MSALFIPTEMTTNEAAPPDPLLTQLETSVAIAVRFSSELLAKLYIDRGEHRHFVLPYDVTTAKRYFLSSCLMDVQRAAAAQLRLVGHLKTEATREPPTAEGLRVVFLESILTEQSVWRRRLVEALSRLILFATTNTDEHYFHYLLLVDAAESEREAENAEKDFLASSATLTRRAADLRAKLAALPPTLPLWYARAGKKGALTAVPATAMIRGALLVASSAEKTALAHSYEHGFAAPSQILHFSTTARRGQLDQRLLEFGASQTMLLSCAIVSRAADLAALPLSASLAGSGTRARPDLPVAGDFVVVTLDPETVFLAEVVTTRRAVGIIGSVRVRFVGDAPYADVLEDDIPSDLVLPFLCAADLAAAVAENLPKDMPLPTKEHLAEAMRFAAERAWTLAMRDVTLRALRASRGR